MSRKLLVIGATGDVGQGLVQVASERGWSVAAAGRNVEKLGEIAARHAGVVAVTGSVESFASAQTLVSNAAAALGGLDAIIVSVNAPMAFKPLSDWDTDGLVEQFRDNVLTHVHAARAALAALPASGILIGVGGGMADWVPPKGAHLSMSQAGLRNFYRGLAKENPDRLIRELQIVSMVNGEKSRSVAQDAWLTDVEIGMHACAILDQPGDFPGPVVILKSREQVGKPDRA
jgi:NAD(P)-dependent dehydrogenase (short-subunit alcohol dehydrogenase family)